MDSKRYTKDACIALLRDKSTALKNLGEERLPKRSDFSESEVIAIKSHFGPWPRALEAAGLKGMRDDGFDERKTQKRIDSKRRKTQAKIANKRFGTGQ